MCIIIAKKAGVKRLDPEYFDRAWDKNPDGGGLVWKKPGEEVYFQKGFMKKEEFLKKIDELNQDDTAFIAHFRIKSVGQVCAENTHPFSMQYVTYAHNGTLNISPFEGKTDSETFGLCFLKDKPMSWIKDYKVLLEMALGSSKFAIMDNVTGEIFILNEELGEERDDAWFSNKSAFPVTPAQALPANYNDEDYYGYGRYSCGSMIKADKSFGTKNYSYPYCHLGPNDVWLYDCNNNHAYVRGYARTCVKHKCGYVIINPATPIPKTGKNKTYTKKSKESKLYRAYLTSFYKDLADYHDATFMNIYEREDAEYELSAKYTVIRVMREFLEKKKAIDDKEFLSFLLDNTKSEAWVKKTSVEKAYSEYVDYYAEQVLSLLEKAKA